jgi:hypothetical protein
LLLGAKGCGFEIFPGRARVHLVLFLGSFPGRAMFQVVLFLEIFTRLIIPWQIKPYIVTPMFCTLGGLCVCRFHQDCYTPNRKLVILYEPSIQKPCVHQVNGMGLRLINPFVIVRLIIFWAFYLKNHAVTQLMEWVYS